VYAESGESRIYIFLHCYCEHRLYGKRGERLFGKSERQHIYHRDDNRGLYGDRDLHPEQLHHHCGGKPCGRRERIVYAESGESRIYIFLHCYCEHRLYGKRGERLFGKSERQHIHHRRHDCRLYGHGDLYS
jgi:hypothetical protein